MGLGVFHPTSTPNQIAENYDFFDYALTKAELNQIARLDRGARYESW